MTVAVDERTLRAVEATGGVGADWALLVSPEVVFYASGLDVPLDLGPSPHAGGPSAAILTDQGEVTLVVEDLQEEAAHASRADHVVVVCGFAPQPHARPLPVEYATAVMGAVEALDPGPLVAVEAGVLPELLAQSLRAAGFSLLDASEELRRARAVKTAEEIDCLRACAELTAAGQRAALESARPEMTELELFAEVRKVMEAAAGRPLSIGVDLLSGVERSAQVMGGPSRRRLVRGDPIICDLVPRHAGYWGDSCNTFVVEGEGSKAFAELRQVVWHALERAVDTIRPGISAGQLDREVRDVIEENGLSDPLHIGHGIGTANSEYPRIVPGATDALEAGMVLMVEPCAYIEEVGGVRLEWMFLVTETGNKVLSPYQHVASTVAATA